MTLVNPHIKFPNFYNNPAITTLAPRARWTISGILGDIDDPKATRKAPIDIQALINHNKLSGAWSPTENCLTTLDELSVHVPAATNATFYLQATLDGLIVIDIEPECPASLSSQLLQLPENLYAEYSMSGRGYHVITPLPTNFHDFPLAATKRVLREEHGWYEILLEHYITFTRRTIENDQIPINSQSTNLTNVYKNLAQHITTTTTITADILVDLEPPNIPYGPRIIEQIVKNASSRIKKLDDFHGDTSRYEFSILGTLYHCMIRCLSSYQQLGCKYSLNDQTWLLYQSATQIIPPRDKHHETRNQRPFLLERARAMIAQKL